MMLMTLKGAHKFELASVAGSEPNSAAWGTTAQSSKTTEPIRPWLYTFRAQVRRTFYTPEAVDLAMLQQSALRIALGSKRPHLTKFYTALP